MKITLDYDSDEQKADFVSAVTGNSDPSTFEESHQQILKMLTGTLKNYYLRGKLRETKQVVSKAQEEAKALFKE